MDGRQVFRDAAVKTEFLERWDEIAGEVKARQGGLEGLDSLPVGKATEVVERIADGMYEPGSQGGLEAIIERFARPVYLVQWSSFVVPPDSFPNSEEIHSKLNSAGVMLQTRLPSAGRIDLRHHRLGWVGTGWMVAEDIVVTNRHVAHEFAADQNGRFAFRRNFGRPPVRASVDWCHEFGQSDESVFRVVEVLWIEPDDSVDVALLRIETHGEDEQPAPIPIALMTQEELAAAGVGTWVAVVGCPAQDSRNDAADQQRIFDGIYNVKRLAPGKVTAVVGTDLLHHDATTLGGNSGSVILDLATGKAIGLHYGGIEGLRNEAVQAPRIQQVLQKFLD